MPPEAKTILIPEAKEIFKREDSSISKWFVEQLTRYVQVHQNGNPQLRIDNFADLPKGECYFCRGHFKTLKKVEYASGLVAPTCGDCLERNRAKGQFSTVKKVWGKA